MTTPSTARKAGPYSGTGAQTSFPFTFKVFAASDVKVVVADANGDETVLTLGAQYSVTLNSNQETSPGGTITYPISGSPLPVGGKLSIVGNLPYDQPLDLPSGGNFSPLALENQLDRATIQIQQLKEQVDRAAKVPVTYDAADLEAVTLDIVRLADSADNIDTVTQNIAAIGTVATNIADVATVADNVADVTNFADVYYGPSATDPTTRRDGSALQGGDLYFNTGAQRMRVYAGGMWTDGVVNTATTSVQRFSGDGSTVAFTLAADPVSENNTQVFIGGVYQQKDTYGVSGTTLTFNVAPPAGTNNIEVVSTGTVAGFGTLPASAVTTDDGAGGALWTTVAGRFKFLDSALPRGVTPTATATATAGNLSGTYYYRVTFTGANGESDASAPSAGVTVSSKQISVAVPTSANPAVTGRKLYRTAGTGGDAVLGKLVAAINDNTTAVFVDNVADGSLGAAAPDFNSSGGVLYLNGQPWASGNSISTRFGLNSNPSNSGYANTAIGANTLPANTTGYRNTSVGVDAHQFNTTGYEMTAVGVHALGGNTTGKQSCAFGYGALENANADYNAAFGTKSGSECTSGSSNSYFGTFSGQLGTTASNNCAFGYQAAYGLTTGTGNACFGYFAGAALGAANFNTFFGFQAGRNITGSSNTGIGLFALFNATTSSDLIGIGANAGSSVTTGYYSIFIGANAGNNASQKVDVFNSTAIGPGTFTTKNNQVVIGNASVEESVIRGVTRGSVYTAATIPMTASAAGAGARTFISDCTVTAAGNFGAVATGGGANFVPLYSDGTNWRIG